MQPLFDNASALQVGFAELVASDEWVPYGSKGASPSRVQAAGDTARMG
jgi:hypothetical protein